MRALAILAATALLAGCSFRAVPDPTVSARDASFMALVPVAEFDPHFARYEVNDRFEMYGGINNLFDTKPDVGASGYPISAVGRSFFVGARAKLF